MTVFYRGEWCPYCNLQLHALQAALPAIRELGASLVAISPQAPDHSLSLTEKHTLAFPVLSDLDQQVIRSYRVQFTLGGDLEDLAVNVFQNDPADQNADHSRSLPVPAVFVIDQGSVVRAAFVSADWRIRVRASRHHRRTTCATASLRLEHRRKDRQRSWSVGVGGADASKFGATRAFALANTRVASVLFGATTPEQVTENARAVALLEQLGRQPSPNYGQSADVADVHPRGGDEGESGALENRPRHLAGLHRSNRPSR